MRVQAITDHVSNFDDMTTETVVDLMKENGYITVECRCPIWQPGLQQWLEQTCKSTVVYHVALTKTLMEGSKGPTYLTSIDRFIWYFKNPRDATLFKLKWY